VESLYCNVVSHLAQKGACKEAFHSKSGEFVVEQDGEKTSLEIGKWV